MTLRNRMRDPSIMMRIGMAFLLVFLLDNYFLHPASFAGGMVEGTAFGIAVGCLLLSVRLRSRGQSAGGCA